MVPVGLLFHLFKKSNVIPQRSGFCVQWEDINSAFTAGSVDSTVETVDDARCGLLVVVSSVTTAYSICNT